MLICSRLSRREPAGAAGSTAESVGGVFGWEAALHPPEARGAASLRPCEVLPASRTDLARARLWRPGIGGSVPIRIRDPAVWCRHAHKRHRSRAALERGHHAPRPARLPSAAGAERSDRGLASEWRSPGAQRWRDASLRHRNSPDIGLSRRAGRLWFNMNGGTATNSPFAAGHGPAGDHLWDGSQRDPATDGHGVGSWRQRMPLPADRRRAAPLTGRRGIRSSAGNHFPFSRFSCRRWLTAASCRARPATHGPSQTTVRFQPHLHARTQDSIT